MSQQQSGSVSMFALPVMSPDAEREPRVASTPEEPGPSQAPTEAWDLNPNPTGEALAQHLYTEALSGQEAPGEQPDVVASALEDVSVAMQAQTPEAQAAATSPEQYIAPTAADYAKRAHAFSFAVGALRENVLRQTEGYNTNATNTSPSSQQGHYELAA